MKPCVIKQPAGIGDIFFCQKIARYMAHHGYQIIWPLKPEIAWIGDYIKGILFCTTEDEFPMKDIYDQATGYVIEDTGAFISTATADITHNDSRIMSSKYTMLGMDTLTGQSILYLNVTLIKRMIYTIMYWDLLMILSLYS